MGGNCDPCIFEHNDSDVKQVHILALYPPSGSVPSREHNNRTSLEIANFFMGFHFQWNDLAPFVPKFNKTVDQALLMQLLLPGNLSNLVHSLQLRMTPVPRRRRPALATRYEAKDRRRGYGRDTPLSLREKKTTTVE